MTDFSPLSSQSQPLEPLTTPSSADALDSSEEPAADVPRLYDYGESTEVPAGYVSDADLLAWLQAKSSGQYLGGSLDRLMDTSNARSKLVKDLSHLKETLSNAAADPQAALAEIQAMQAAYAGTSHAEEVDALLAPIEGQLENYVNASASVDAMEMDGLSERESARMKNELKANATEFGGFSGSVDATVKDLEHDDQLALVQIQALMSDIRESAQLTSNILANRSQTSDGIVGNIRA